MDIDTDLRKETLRNNDIKGDSTSDVHQPSGQIWFSWIFPFLLERQPSCLSLEASPGPENLNPALTTSDSVLED